MTPEKTPGIIPERELPKFEISKKEVEGMKTAAAIMDMLADDPDAIKGIVEVFMKASTAKPEERMLVGQEVKNQVINIVSEKMKDMPMERIEKYYPQWSQVIAKSHMPWTQQFAHMPKTIVDPGPEF